MSSDKPGHFFWSRVEPYWGRLNEAWDGGTTQFTSAMSSAPPRVLNLYAANWCVSEVLNGGLHQFFYNTTGILAPEAVTGFSAIGATELAEVLSEAMRFFGDPYPRDRVSRLELLPDIDDETEEEENPFSSLDDRFYAWMDAEANRWELLADRYAAAA